MIRVRAVIVAAALVSLAVGAGDLSAQDRRVHERSDRWRDQDFGESVRLRVEEALRRSEDALRRSEDAMRRLDGARFHMRDHVGLRVDVQERVREALRRVESHRFDSDIDGGRHDAMADAIRDRVHDHLFLDFDHLRHLDNLHFRLDDVRLHRDDLGLNSESRRLDVDGLRLGDEIRARVRDELSRSEDVRARAMEQAREALRRVDVRIRDRQ